jgi:hypothetical protein
MHSKTGDRQMLPMPKAFTKVRVSFIGASLLCYNIGLNFAALIPHIEGDGALTLIDVAMDVLDSRNPTTYLYIDIGVIFFAEVWAIGYNPVIINDLWLSPISQI